MTARRQDRLRISGYLGVGGPFVLASTMIVLTCASLNFLRAVGWSPIRRTPTEWPSLLALAPQGVFLNIAFVIGSLCVASLAWGVLATDHAHRKLMAVGLLLSSIGLVGVTFNADLPSAAQHSWHGHVHNTLYNLIPLGFLMAAASTAFPGKTSNWHPSLSTSSRILLSVAVLSLMLTTIPEIAQLVRFAAFTAMLAWTAMVGAACVRLSHQIAESDSA